MRYTFNPYRSSVAAEPRSRAREFHRTLEGYAPTPLRDCRGLGERLGVRCVYVKDEAGRFGLNAFKVLGASWGMAVSCQPSAVGCQLTYSAATDGNHGRAVAWMARRMGARAEIFVPANMVEGRRELLRAEGARVHIVDGTYDEAVRACAAASAAHGWQVVSDTAYPGYMEIPERIVEGYGTLFEEAAEQMSVRPDFVFLQAGVGGLLAAGVRHFGDSARMVCVEPEDADCLLESIG